MRKQRFSEELLKSIRETLPHGSQTNISQKLSTLDSTVTVREVNKVLRGKGIRYGRFDTTPIVIEAIAICKAVKESQQEVIKAAEEMAYSSVKQQAVDTYIKLPDGTDYRVFKKA